MNDRYSGKCFDCGITYGDEFGFPDLIISNDAWRAISPTGDSAGLLCPSCMCRRLHRAGMSNVYGAFTSGPIRSIEEPVMHALKWVEEIRETLEANGVYK